MKHCRFAVIAAFALSLAGCGATTQEVEKSVESKYLGQPSDAFFMRYGAPQSSFKLNDGGTMYRWRGGETTINVPAQYRTVAPAAPVMESGRSTTTTNVSRPDESTTITRSTTRGYSFSVGVPTAQQVLVSPAQTVQIFCEAEITTNPGGMITHIHATQDTRGVGFSLSRCAEVFEVK